MQEHNKFLLVASADPVECWVSIRNFSFQVVCCFVYLLVAVIISCSIFVLFREFGMLNALALSLKFRCHVSLRFTVGNGIVCRLYFAVWYLSISNLRQYFVLGFLSIFSFKFFMRSVGMSAEKVTNTTQLFCCLFFSLSLSS